MEFTRPGATDPALPRALSLAGLSESSYGPLRGRAAGWLLVRATQLGLSADQYSVLLETDERERTTFEAAVGRRGSGLYRGHATWKWLRDRVLPGLAGRQPEPRAWCAADPLGADAATLVALWLDSPATRNRPLFVLSTDPERDAPIGIFPPGTGRSMPEHLRNAAFDRSQEGLTLRPEARRLIRRARHDAARDPWPWELDLILMRGYALRFWTHGRRGRVVQACHAALRSHGVLALGPGESLPESALQRFEPVSPHCPLYRRRA